MMSFEEAVQYLRNCGLVADIMDPQTSILKGDEVLSGGTAYRENSDAAPENLFFIIREEGQVKFYYKGDISLNFMIFCESLEQACRFVYKLLLGTSSLTEAIQFSEKSLERLTQAKLHTCLLNEYGKVSIIGGSLDLDLNHIKNLLLHRSSFTQAERDKGLAEFRRGFNIRCWGGIIIGEIRGYGITEGIVAYSTNLDVVVDAICRYYETGKLPDTLEKVVDI